jgi:hypothetical protein
MGLADESVLSDELLRQLINVGEVDVLVGLPTYNNSQTVGHVIQVVREGLLKYFPRERTAILNADGGSNDGTPELVQAASISDARNSSAVRALRTMHCFSTRYPGMPSSSGALHTIMAAADLVRARACAVISPESSSITPEWIDLLVRPTCREDYDFVPPVYCRHKFDGLLVTNLLYPMSRAMYRFRIREPYPGDFGFSGRLGAAFLSQDSWHDGGLGAELRLTLAAMTGGFRIEQTFLGPKKSGELRPENLVPIIRQTVGTLFSSLDQYFSNWSTEKVSQPMTIVGAECKVNADPIRVNRKRLHQMFRSGVAELEPVLASILSPATHEELKRAATLDEIEFRYSDELWVKTIYEFAASYHHSVISQDHVIQALVPLYRGRAFTFLVENREADGPEVEQRVECLCETFERRKPYLLELWKKTGGS